MNELIEINKLNISQAYQRTVKRSRVKSIVENFDKDAVGSLCVGRRTDGTNWVVDGQQRLAAIRQLGFTSVACDVFESTGVAHEAKVFRNKNKDRTGVTPFTIFKALVVEGDEMAVSIQATAESCGLVISEGKSGWPNLKCVSALQHAYDLGGTALVRNVLQVINDAWIGEGDALHASIIGGLACLISTHPDADNGRLVKVLSPKSPLAICRASDSYKMWSGSRPRAVSNAILDIYNKGLRSSRLEAK